MKLARIDTPDGTRAAVVTADGFIDLTTAIGLAPDDLPSLLAGGAEGRLAVERCLRTAPRLRADSVRLRSPIARADKILGVGMNYRSFVAAVERLGIPLPRERIWFYRPSACIAGPSDDIVLPQGADDLEYEAELAVVIGRRGHGVTAAEAAGLIGGFTVANDVTLRQRVLRSLVFGKSCETHLPLGPWIVTADEIADPHDLAIRTWVNGELRQDARTSEMMASCSELIEEVSAYCTLNPGDIILTGTPVGSGVFQDPPRSLTAGDIVKIEIEGIGVIENRVID